VNKGVAVVLASHLSLFENGVMDGEIFLPQLPQDQRRSIEPYLDLPPSMGLRPVISIPKISDGSAMLLSRSRD